MSVGHWRNSYRPVKFFFMDAPFGVIIVLSVVHIRYYTIALDILVILLAFYLRRLGVGIPTALRAARATLAGDVRPAMPFRKTRRKVDYEHRRLAWQPEVDTSPVDLNPVEKDAS